MSRVGYKTMIAWLAMTVVAGCSAGSGVGLDQNGQPIGSGGGTTPLTPDFKSIQDNVFTPICTRCHIGAGAPQGLQLDAAHSYALLVGVPSAEEPSLLRVKPTDPDNSYIIHKLEGGPNIVGVQMPADGPPYLPQATINVIRQWITNGALQAMATGATASSKSVGSGQSARDTGPAAGFAVTATSPLNDSVVTEPVTRIVVAFNHEIDASLVNYTTVTLQIAHIMLTADSMLTADPVMLPAPMPSAGTPAPQVPISTAIAEGDPAVMLITPRVPLAAGTYRVTLRGAGGGALADVNAQVLGADYSFTFTVDVSQ